MPRGLWWEIAKNKRSAWLKKNVGNRYPQLAGIGAEFVEFRRDERLVNPDR